MWSAWGLELFSGLAVLVYYPYRPGTLHAGRSRGFAGRAADGNRHQPCDRHSLCDRVGLAAVAGLLFAVQAGQLTPYMGFTPVLKAFIAAVIGGFGSISGAIVGGYALGGLEVLLTAIPGIGDILPPDLVSPGVQAWLKQWLPSSLTSYRDAFVFVVLILVLLFRPNGIVGRREREEMG